MWHLEAVILREGDLEVLLSMQGRQRAFFMSVHMLIRSSCRVPSLLSAPWTVSQWVVKGRHKRTRLRLPGCSQATLDLVSIVGFTGLVPWRAAVHPPPPGIQKEVNYWPFLFCSLYTDILSQNQMYK